MVEKTKRSCRRKERKYPRLQLEFENCHELDPARSTSTDEWVTDAHIAGRGDMVRSVANLAACAVRHKPASTAAVTNLAGGTCRVREESGQKWIGEVRVIQNIEEVGTELHGHALRERRGLVEREIPLFKRRATQRVAAFVPEMTGAGHAVRGRTGDRGRIQSGPGRAWDCERRQIQEVERISRIIL
ncbi:MAG: hypothetical protein QOF56_3410, partial [Acidobacteriaceae bacterium]|nr:hypothetical protein [Acidobacteriaceae bacterium]